MAQRAFSDFIGFSRASAAWRFNSAGVLVQEAANVARDDYDPATLAWRGLLIEEQRTNAIRNNSMVAAAAGTPGTLPNNWAVSATSGLSYAVAGVGTDSGIPYVDVRIFGTTTATSGTSVFLESTAGGAAGTATQTFAYSAFLKLVAGSLPAGWNTVFAGNYHTSGGAYVNSNQGGLLAVPAATAALTASRQVSAFNVTNDGTIALVRPALSFTNISSGAVVDFTIRIGAPQLEQGAFGTSPILTAGAAVTRVADTPMVGGLPPWFNPIEGTLYAEAMVPAYDNTNGHVLAQVDDGSNSGRLLIQIAPGGAGLRGYTAVAGAQVVSVVGGPHTAGAVQRLAFAYKASDYAVSANGAAAVTAATAGALPTVIALSVGGDRNGRRLNGWLRALKYKPLRMTNAELQAITA